MRAIYAVARRRKLSTSINNVEGSFLVKSFDHAVSNVRDAQEIKMVKIIKIVVKLMDGNGILSLQRGNDCEKKAIIHYRPDR